MINSLGCTVSPPGACKVGEFRPDCKKLPTLDPPGRKMVHPTESNTDIKVVQNHICDNFYFDLNIVQPKLN